MMVRKLLLRKLLLRGPVFFLVLISAVGAFGTGEEERVEITGRLRLVGSASFNDLVLTDATGRDWYVDDSERAKLTAYEQQVITLRAIVKRREIVLANGKKLPDRRVLTEINVVE